MASISFLGVNKVFPDGTKAVSDLNLELQDGELTVLVGPSGCGKTTSLRMVAGLEEITDGEIRIGDRVVNNVEPEQRDVAMVFQNYALYPHMNVFENIAFPLRSARVAKSEIQSRVQQTADLLGLRDLVRRRPKQLSGGQRQRVAMGRAIVRQPQAFLMDEPLSNLDAKLRAQMRGEITRLQHALGVTTLYVTHDQVEAMTMGQQIAVMRKGMLQQHGQAQDIYDHPANLFVASFIGSPAMNLVEGIVENDSDGLAFRIGGGDQCLKVPGSVLPNGIDYRAHVGSTVAVGIRPEHLIDPLLVTGPTSSLAGEVLLVETLGFERLVTIEIAGKPVVTSEVLEVAHDLDDAVVQTLSEEVQSNKVAMTGRLGVQSTDKVAVGDVMEFAVRAEGVRLFDLETGTAIV